MKKFLIILLLLSASKVSMAAHESTAFGKITGIESRDWGMHIQTTFGAGASNGCATSVGNTYMYDFQYSSGHNGDDPSDEISMILAAFASQSDIAFHIYGCNTSGNRPVIGFIRLRK